MLTLYEILEIINDNAVVDLWNSNAELIGVYDGKESIDEIYNDFYVYDIYASNYGKIPVINICIDET